MRDVGRDDFDELIGMMRDLYASDQVPFDEERARRATSVLLVRPEHGRLAVMESEGKTAGYLALTFGFSLEFGGRYAYIDELFVVEDYRGRGLGTAAISYAKTVCEEERIGVLLLEADLHNDGAARLYRRLGFQEHRRRLMSLRLGAENVCCGARQSNPAL